MTQSFALALSALLLAVPSHPRASLRAPRAARTSAVAERVQPLDTARLRTHLQALTAPAMEGRGAGYPGDLRAAHYIARQFRAAGLRPAGDGNGYLQALTLHPRRPTVPFDVRQT